MMYIMSGSDKSDEINTMKVFVPISHITMNVWVQVTAFRLLLV